MVQVLLWACFVVGIAVYLFRYLPFFGEKISSENPSSLNSDSLDCHAALRGIGIAAPFLGWIVTLPTHGIFASGQQLGVGFLLGGIAALLSQISLGTISRFAQKAAVTSATQITALYGAAIAAVAAALLFLPASRPDSLMGVAIGWFCTTLAFYLSLPRDTRNAEPGQQMALGTGMMVTLTATILTGVYRDAISSVLPSLSWSTVCLSFAGIATLLLSGIARFRSLTLGIKRLLPLCVLLLGGGLGLYEAAMKLTNEPKLAFIGIGGLLLWPVLLAVMREAERRSSSTSAMPSLFLPMVLVATALVAAVQVMQGTGTAIVALALYLGFPATTLLFGPTSSEDSAETDGRTFTVQTIGLLLFSTVLVLWRLFSTRWGTDLRGVTLTDQYALFGILTGTALPILIANLASSWQGGKAGSNVQGILTLVGMALLTLAAPAIVLILFGTKSVLALLIGLALGVIFALIRVPSLLPALLAVAVGLALDQWGGRLLSDAVPTRWDKIRYLIGLMAVIVTVTLSSDLFARWRERRGR